MTIRSLLPVVLVTCFIAGCSVLKTYSSDLTRNLTISAVTDSDVDVAVDIHRVKPDCSTGYSGTVELDQSPVKIGIPSNRSTYLVFVFQSSGFFTGDSTMTTDFLIRPRSAYQYNAEVSYSDNIYNVVIYEKSADGKRKLELDHKDLSACRPIK